MAMTKIEFKKTSNVFINIGIVALYRLLNRPNFLSGDFGYINNQLLSDKLIIENERLLELLEEAYYSMGKEIYDTPTRKQIEQADKFFFIKKPFSYGKFPKMLSFGLAGFITKPPFGPQPTPRVEPVKFSKLLKDEPVFAHQIANVYKENNLKLKYHELLDAGPVENKEQHKGDSYIYMDEPYSKTPRIKFDANSFSKGGNYCPVLNEGFKTLVSSKGSFPFTSNLENFNSFLNTDDYQKISFTAKYLYYFAPAIAMYLYYNNYNSFSASFFNSSTLTNINSLYSDEFFFTKDEMESLKIPFQRNIKLENFKYSKKDDEHFVINSGEDSYSPQEITFLLIYTFYLKKFDIDIENDVSKVDIDPFEGTPFKKTPISLVTFKADKFAETMRPNFYEEYSNVKFIIRLIHLLETNTPKRVEIRELWRGLVFKSPKSDSIKDYGKKMKLERKQRAEFLSKILKGKSTLKDLESLFSKSFLVLSNGGNCGYRRYDLLTEFLLKYEPIINFGGINMDKSLQQRAINLGKSIGQSVINFGGPKNENEKKTNAKNGRKYLIGLHKARTLDQFLEGILRIQNKYQVSVSNEILEKIEKDNFIAIRQYALIGALNQINTILSNKKPNDNENK